MVREKLSLVSVVALAALIAAPGGASSATEVGETFTPNAVPTDLTNPCYENYTFVQSTSPSGQYAMPSAGVITS